MNRLQKATWAALAGLGLLSGCRSTNPCDPCEDRGFFSRICGGRRNGVFHGPVSATPVSSMSLGSDCCDGPILGDPPFGGPGMSVLPGPSFDGGMGLPPITTMPSMAAPPITGLPAGPFPPMTTLPTPTPGLAPPLAPVPNGNGLATPTPAGPSTMSRIR